MDGIALNVDSLDWAYELAAAASYAEIRSGLGDGEASLKGNHVDGLYGAVLSAGSATGAVYIYYADILVEYHAPRLCMVFLLNGKRFDGSCGAYLAAQVAVIVAVALVKLHHGLHDAPQAVFHSGRFEHMAGALAYTQVAGGAVLE